MRVLVAALLLIVAVDTPAQERVQTDSRREEAERRKLDQISTIVKGQCVDGSSGAPLAGCRVEVRAWGRNTEDLAAELMRPEPVFTGDDGRFEVRVLAHEGLQVGFDASLEGRWPRTGRWRYLLPGVVEDLGAVPLHPGVYAVGKVVDASGKAVREVMVGIDELRLYVGSEDDVDDERPLADRLLANAESGSRVFHLHANKVRWCRTDADGLFTSKDALPPGTFELTLGGRGVSLVEPKHITIPEQGPMSPVTIVVREDEFLGGVVVDETGQPVAGVELHAQFQRAGSGRLASAMTAKDGSFKIYRVDDAPDTASISVMDPGPCERPGPTGEFPWGTTDIRIEMRRALAVDVIVVEAATGKPIEEFAIRAYPLAGGMNSNDQRLRLSGRHDDGKLKVTDVPRGTNRVVIVPKDQRLLCTHVDITAVEGMAPIRIEVDRLVPMMVQVLDAKGKPIERATVLVVVPGNWQRDSGRSNPNNPRADSMGAFSTDPKVTFDTEIYRATTDGGGQCIVYGISGREDLILGVRVGAGELHREADVAFGPDAPGRTVTLDKK